MNWKSIALPALIACCSTTVFSQTMGLMQYDAGMQDGYILFAPVSSTTTYLADKCGKEVHQWTSTHRPGQSVYLLPDGSLLRPGTTNNMTFNAGGSGGVIERMDWSSALLWSYTISDTNECQHHDICYLPGGNILAIVWEKKSVAEAIAMGRDPALTGTSLWSEKIVELQPAGTGGATIVWEWHVWDHLNQDFDATLPAHGVIGDHPELININYYSGMPTGSDWLHINAVTYNAALNQIMLSVHNFNEVWIIDHSTTTAEAAGHTGGTHGKGGDLIYRWGNPAAYNQGTAADRKLYGQHNAHWIPDGLTDSGKIIIFNNGQGRPGGNFSTIDIIDPPADASGNYSYTPGAAFGPAALAWSYQATPPANFFAANISGMQRLENGNTLICSGPSGTFFEIDASKDIVWKYINPVNATGPMTQGATPMQNAAFRCTQYNASYAGLAGHTLTAGAPVELSPLAYTCGTTTITNAAHEGQTAVANPFANVISLWSGKDLRSVHMLLSNITGRVINEWNFESVAEGQLVSIPVDAALPCGIYMLTLSGEGYATHFRLQKE